MTIEHPISKLAARKFWEYVKKRDGDDCWQWLGKLHSNGGYGVFAWKGRHLMAARFAYELEFGPIRNSAVLVPQCHNRGCVRAAHWKPESRSQAFRKSKTIVDLHEALPPMSIEEMFHVKQFLGTGGNRDDADRRDPPPDAPLAHCTAMRLVPLLRRIGTEVGTVGAALPRLATAEDVARLGGQIADVLQVVERFDARLALLESAQATAAAEDEEPPAAASSEVPSDPGAWLDNLWSRVGHGAPDRQGLTALFDAALAQREHSNAALYLVLEWGADFRRHTGRRPASVAELEAYVVESGALTA